MNKTAWISLGTFLVLLVLVFVTREDHVAVGVRALTLPTFDADKVTKIEVRSKDKSALLEKVGGTKEQPQWTVADPEKPEVKLAASPSQVKTALDALAELSAEGFVTGRKEKHADLEIGEEKGVTVTLTQGGKATALVFGRFAKGGGNYVRLADSDEVFVGKGRFAGAVKKDVKAWRKRKLLPFEAKDLRALTLAPAGQPELKLKGEGGEGDTVNWSLEGVALPAGFRLDTDALGRIANAVAGLRATDFADEGALGEVQGTVSGKTVDDQSFTVRFGAVDDKKRVFTQLEGDAQLYLLSEYTVKSVLKSLEELRSLNLIELDAAKATKAEFTGPDGRVIVEKTDAGWALVEPAAPPEGYDFDPSQVEPKLEALGRLKASGLASPEKLPVAKPAEQVTVAVTVDGQVKTLAFGDEIPRAEDDKGAVEHYAYSAEDEMTYKVGQWQRNRYAKPLELFKRPVAPQGPPGGGIPGMENLPPEIRKQLEAQLKQQGLPGR